MCRRSTSGNLQDRRRQRFSNFVLPLYFTGAGEVGGRNDFLGRIHDGKTLRSFSVNPGGYIGFYDPLTGEHSTFSRKGDTVAEERMKIKSRAKDVARYPLSPH